MTNRLRILAALGVALLAVAKVAAGSFTAQSPGLRIVVIEGEGAVNIIQQKTAVAPVVEVRDRNNLPVPGAVVTFSVSGGQGATLGGGLQTLTVTTNAAGQAIATGLTPTATGAIQINATVAFQGQTATATIAQTNVATAAQAAQAAGASTGTSGAGAGAGSGGGSSGAAGGAGAGAGLSGTTIGIIGAAVGGGALVATQAGGSSDGATAPATVSVPCSYTMSPTSQAATAAGGTFSATLTSTCAWSISSDAPWLNVSSGASGSGTATIAYAVSANTSDTSRTGRLSITGAGGSAMLVVSQEAGGPAGTWSGSLASAGTVIFGGGVFCSYSITLTDIRSTLVVTGSSVTAGQVTLTATEVALQGCPFAPIPPNTHTYTVESSSIAGSNVTVRYRPGAGNAPFASLDYTAVLSSDGTSMTGTLAWHRTDIATPLDWRVSATMTMTRSR